MAVELSPAARAFLEETHFAVMATTQPDGTAQLSVVWYVLDGDDILMNTLAGRVKDRNLQRDPRIGVCVEDGYRYISLYGSATLNDDQPAAQADMRRLAVRYRGDEAGNKQADEVYAKQQRVTIRMSVTRLDIYGF